MTSLWRAQGEPAAKGASTMAAAYDNSAYYKKAVAWADTAGLLAGTASAFKPTANCPRCNIVQYLYKNANTETATTTFKGNVDVRVNGFLKAKAAAMDANGNVTVPVSFFKDSVSDKNGITTIKVGSYTTTVDKDIVDLNTVGRALGIWSDYSDKYNNVLAYNQDLTVEEMDTFYAMKKESLHLTDSYANMSEFSTRSGKGQAPFDFAWSYNDNNHVKHIVNTKDNTAEEMMDYFVNYQRNCPRFRGVLAKGVHTTYRTNAALTFYGDGGATINYGILTIQVDKDADLSKYYGPIGMTIEKGKTYNLYVEEWIIQQADPVKALCGVHVTNIYDRTNGVYNRITN